MGSLLSRFGNGRTNASAKRGSDRIRHRPRKRSGSLLKAVALFTPGSAVIAWTIQKSNERFSTHHETQSTAAIECSAENAVL